MKFRLLIVFLTLCLLLGGCAVNNASDEVKDEHICSFVSFRSIGETHYSICECGIMKKNAHTFEEVTILEPTCFKDGKTLKYCVYCEYKTSEQLKKTDHTHTVISSKDPTCLSDGNTESVYCAECDAVVRGNEILKSTLHIFEDDRCVECSAEKLNDKLRVVTRSDGNGYLYLAPSSKLEELTIPNNAEKKVIIDELRDMTSDYLKRVTVQDGVKRLYDRCFMNCFKLEDVDLAEGTVFGDDVFRGCGSLREITIPDGTEALGKGTFRDCASLVKINGLDNINVISDNAFWGCRSIESIELSDGLTELGEYAFRGCLSLAEINIPNGINEIKCGTFLDCKLLSNVSIPKDLVKIGDLAFQGCALLDEIIIPSNVESIGHYAFAGCERITEITLPENLTFLGNGAFQEMNDLEKVVFPKNITAIPDFLFYVSGIKTIEIPNTVTTLGMNAFSNCASLYEITIPKSVKAIGAHCFSNSNALTEIKYEGTVEEWNDIEIGENVFYGKARKIICSDGVVEIEFKY